MAVRSVSVSGEQFQELSRLAKSIRLASTGVGKFTSPDSLASAFIARGIEQARNEWYDLQARIADDHSLNVDAFSVLEAARIAEAP